MERSQIRIRGQGKKERGKTRTLYRHYDGSQERVIEDIKKAHKKYGKDLNAGDPRYVASFICSSDPTRFTFWKNNKFLMVSNFYDLVIVSEPKNGKKADWKLAVYGGPQRIPSKENPLKLKDYPVRHKMQRLEDYISKH